MALYEITIKGTKTFYIEADTQEQALESPVVHDEMSGSMGDFEWEASEGEANKCDKRSEDYARKHESKLIVPNSEE